MESFFSLVSYLPSGRNLGKELFPLVSLELYNFSGIASICLIFVRKSLLVVSNIV